MAPAISSRGEKESAVATVRRSALEKVSGFVQATFMFLGFFEEMLGEAR